MSSQTNKRRDTKKFKDFKPYPANKKYPLCRLKIT